MACSAGIAILISFFTGMATVVGGVASLLLVDHMKPVTFAAALAFAAGCTLTVAFADVLPEGQEAWAAMLGGDEEKDSSLGLLVMLGGWVIASGFDRALHWSLDAYDHCTGAEGHAHVGVCTHDHTHDHQHTDSMNDITEPIIVNHLEQQAEHQNGHSHSTCVGGSPNGIWAKIGRVILSIFVKKSCLSDEEQELVDSQFKQDAKKISRIGYFTACVLALHNIPEGIALYGTLTANQNAGIGLAIAISLHNLPQGMAVAVPIFIGLQSKWKAVLFSFAAAVAQPLGALLGYAIVGTDPSDNVMSIMLLLTSGVLFNASLKELYGAAVKYDRGNQVCGTFIFIGMLILSVTLIAIAYM